MRHQRAVTPRRPHCCTEAAPEPRIDSRVCLHVCALSAILCPDEAGQLSNKAQCVAQVGEVTAHLLGYAAGTGKVQAKPCLVLAFSISSEKGMIGLLSQKPRVPTDLQSPFAFRLCLVTLRNCVSSSPIVHHLRARLYQLPNVLITLYMPPKSKRHTVII